MGLQQTAGLPKYRTYFRHPAFFFSAERRRAKEVTAKNRPLE
jgi:hypothetical protein